MTVQPGKWEQQQNGEVQGTFYTTKPLPDDDWQPIAVYRDNGTVSGSLQWGETDAGQLKLLFGDVAGDGMGEGVVSSDGTYITWDLGYQWKYLGPLS